MKKFIAKILMLSVIVLSVYLGIALFAYFIMGDQYQYNYQASVSDKINRLENISDPKIILVGNSNVAFGMNSEKIENELNMQVVNLGVHGGLGNAFHERMAKYNINKGDIVIVCHSTFSDTGNILDPSLAWITVGQKAKLWKLIGWIDYWPMFKAYPNYIKSSLNLWLTGTGNREGDVYTGRGFNEYGDIVQKPQKYQMNPQIYFSNLDINMPEINDICITRLNKYNKYINEQGATLLIAGYPIAYGEYSTYTKEDFIEFGNELQATLDCDVISDYTDYLYPYDYFYNTYLHLTKEGAEVRTDQLISDLKQWIKKDKNRRICKE